MADYSRYGGEAADWAACLAANAQPVQPAGLTPLQLQKLTNAGREANAKEILKSINGRYLCNYYS